MRSITQYREDAAMGEPHYLDEPWLVQRLALERARAALRLLAQDRQLPPALRSSCARMFRTLGRHLETLRTLPPEQHRQEP
jgi:hypothetical protein